MAPCQGPRAQMVRLFWSLPVFGRKMLRKPQSTNGPAQCKSGPGNNMLVGVTIYCTFFKNDFPPPCQFFHEKMLFKKKLAWGNAH